MSTRLRLGLRAHYLVALLGACALVATSVVAGVAQADAQPTCRGLTVTIDIGAGQEPTPGPDVILGTNGPDEIDAGGGDDVVCAGAGNDTVFGGDGDDILVGSTGDDVLHGGAGRDLLRGNSGDDILNGGPGRDRLNGNMGDDELNGGPGSDDLDGESGSNTMNGDGGPDLIIGHAGADIINGGGGPDIIFGGSGSNVIDAGPGDDFVNTGGGADMINGGPGDDLLEGGRGPDTIHGDAGDDVLEGQYDADDLIGGPGTDIANGGAAIDTCDAETILWCENNYGEVLPIISATPLVTNGDGTVTTTISVTLNGPDFAAFLLEGLIDESVGEVVSCTIGPVGSIQTCGTSVELNRSLYSAVSHLNFNDSFVLGTFTYMPSGATDATDVQLRFLELYDNIGNPLMDPLTLQQPVAALADAVRARVD